jgi:hypothetical protein
MDFHSFNKKLNKIVALADNGNPSGEFSALERDLMLNYIRELYDIALDDKPIPRHIPVEVPFVQPVEAVKNKVEVPIVEATEPVIKEEVKHEIHHLVSEPIHVEVKEAVISKVTTPVASEQHTDEEALHEIFADEKISDLSDRLSLTPIKEISKSMGINEKIFTQQELFGNDQVAFTATLERLDKCSNFEEAKQFLIDSIIYKYQWVNEKKIKKAATFVRLVKRKFS